jgi:ferrous iron transport protein B
MIRDVKHCPPIESDRPLATSTQPLVVALAGNPNSGKTTLFNRLTGARQHVGNYPGVTVERKEGACHRGGVPLKIVDLPGTYSLTAFSVEEKVARNFIVEDRPDVVVDIIDATNLERNLYLAVQLLELGAPLVLAFNLCDATQQSGIQFDLTKLSASFGAPIVQTSGKTGDGLDVLLGAVVERARHRQEWSGKTVNYGPVVEREIASLGAVLAAAGAGQEALRWLAIKLLENDPDLIARYTHPPVVEALAQSRARIERETGEEASSLIAGARYAFIAAACQDTVQAPAAARRTMSDRIDAVATHRFFGLPLFLGVMYLVFQLTFTASAAPMDWIEGCFGWLGGVVGAWWPEGAESPLKSLLTDGLIAGVGGVLVFMPNILCLFLAIAILEDSGYMARAAFIMDRLMHQIGLHGKSFIPMLIGFGCSVPAIMATRTLESRRDRLATMLVIPLMSCGARLPIYSLIIPAFFPAAWRAPMLWLIYLIGMVLAVALAKLLRCTALQGAPVPFIMELPPYRIPTLRDVAIHMWERGWLYIKKAGTIILGISILLWAMTNYPKKTVFDRDYEAESARARAVSVEAIQRVGATLGLPVGDTRLQEAIQAFPALAGLAESFVASAPEVQPSGSAVAVAPTPAHDPVVRFQTMRDQIVAARAALEADKTNATLTDAQRAESDRTHARKLAELEQTDPVAYGAAAKCLDEIEAPFVEAKAKIARDEDAEKLSYSLAGRLGHLLQPALAPLGFDWRIGTALIGAFAAKEVFVAQMGIVYSVGDADENSASLREKLRANYTPLAAFCIMLFCLVSTPCMATTAVVRKESGSWGWAIGQWVGLTLVAYLLTLVAYQGGTLLGF